MEKDDAQHRREALESAYGTNDFFGPVHLDVIEHLLAHEEGSDEQTIARETERSVESVRRALSDLRFSALIEHPSQLINKSIEENVRRFRAVLPKHLVEDVGVYRLAPDASPERE